MPRQRNITAARLRSMEQEARQRASDLGHQLTAFEPDGFAAEVAICIMCERIAAIDANPEGGLIGRALERSCDRVPVVGLYCTCLACVIEKGA